MNGTQNIAIRYPWSSVMIERAKKMTSRHGKGADAGKGGQFAPGDISDKLTGDRHIDDPLIAFKNKEKARVRAAKKAKQLAGMSKDDANYSKVAAESKALNSERDAAIAEFKRVRVEAKKAGYKVDSRGKSINQNASTKQTENKEDAQLKADLEHVKMQASIRDEKLKVAQELIANGTIDLTKGETITRTKEYRELKTALDDIIRDNRATTSERNEALLKRRELVSMKYDLTRKGRVAIAQGDRLQDEAWAEYEANTGDQHARLMTHYKKEGAAVRKKMMETVDVKRLSEIGLEQRSLEQTRANNLRHEAIISQNVSISRKNAQIWEKRGNQEKANAELSAEKLYKVKQSDYRRYIKEDNAKIEALEMEKVKLLGNAAEQLKVDDPLSISPAYVNNTTGKYKVVVEDGFERVSNLWSRTTVFGDSTIAVKAISGRASSAGDRLQIELSQKVDDYSIVAHEIAHTFENNRILGETVNYWKQRTGKTTNQIAPLPGFSRAEKGDPDNFPSPYDGKLYKSRRVGAGVEGVTGTELISKGTEYMVKNPVDFANADPDYFDFIYAITRSG